MALTQVKTTGIADDAVTGAKIADDTVAEANMANDAIGLAELKAGTDGQILTFDASGNPAFVGPGTDGQVLTSTGSGSPPAFEAASGGIASLVADTSPQLGGDLDTNSFEISLDDSHAVKFGDGNDLQIYHDGSNSYVKHDGTGTLSVRTNGSDEDLYLEGGRDVYITQGLSDGGENAIICKDNGAVELYYDNSKKFETASHGINIHEDTDKVINFSGGIGEIGSVPGLQGSNTAGSALTSLGMRGTDLRFATGNAERLRITSGGNVSIPNDSGKFLAGTGDDLQIYHDGSNSFIENNVGHLYIQNDSSSSSEEVLIRPKGGEQSGKFVPDGQVELYYDNALKFNTEAAGAQVHGHLRVDDSNKFQCGTSQDLALYHNGTDSYIDNATGNLQLRVATSEKAIIGVPNGAVELYYDNSKKLDTTSTGINITGGIRLGGNNAANECDDYEEGTVTASFTADNGTITLNGSYDTLAYTKVGRVVHIQGYLNISVSGVSGWYKISGLPFTPANLTDGAGDSFSTMTTYANGPDGNGYYMGYVEIKEGASAFKCTLPNASGKQSLAAGSSLTSSTDFILDVTYIAA